MNSGGGLAGVLPDLALIEQLPSAVLITDPAGVLVRCNRRGGELWGAPGGIAPKLYSDAGRPLDMEDAPIVMALRTGAPVRNVEIWIDRPGCPRICALTDVDVLRDPNGAVVGAIACLRDVTERKDEEAGLLQQQSFLRTLVDTTPECVKLVSRDGEVLRINAAGARMVGAQSAAQMVGANVFTIIAPEDVEPWRAQHLRVCDGESLNWEYQIICMDGSRRSLETHAVPMKTAQWGVVQLAVTRDVTERQQQQAQQQDGARRLIELMHALPTAVYTTDAEGRITFYNQGAVDLWGYKPVLHKTRWCGAWKLYHADGAPMAHDESPMALALKEGRAIRDVEAVLERPDGVRIPFAPYPTPLHDSNGAIVGAVNMLVDISRHRAAEDAQQRLIDGLIQAERELIDSRDAAEAGAAAKSAFLATMSHEIRTPLNGVLGMVQAMSKDPLSPVQAERLDVIQKSGVALLAILNDLLDLSKIEAGRFELEDGECDIDEIAGGVSTAFTTLASEKDIGFTMAVSPAAHGVYRGDATRMRQILYNLVSNALKFTPTGSVTVDIDRLGDCLIIQVADTGVGIPADRLPVLFEKFVQADASTTRKYGGTGLGLAICRELATLMGGEIDVESTPGLGSTFTVTLPLERLSQAPRSTAEQVARIEQAPPSRDLRILAAEDNAMNQLVLKTLLHQVGVEPVLVGDGAEAVEAWRAAVWDVILMDIQMPTMDGPTAAKKIRDEEARTGRRRTPIIALTANAMSHQADGYRASGMDAVVSKPIEVGQLYAALEAVLAAEEPEAADEAMAG